jgi:cysteine desulfurase/selenocysteine lyase
LIRTPGTRMTVDVLERMWSPRTRLVAVSMVGFVDGYRHDIDAIGAWCKAKEVLFAVDAIQGFGHLPLDVKRCAADFCYFGVAKWLLSPQALSIVFVRREHIDRLRPAMGSWRSAADPMRFLDYAQEFNAGAARFEGGTINYPAVVGFGESLKLIREAGLDAIERHVLRLNDRLIRSAVASGIAVQSDVDPKVRSGIVVLGLGRYSVDELTRRADAADVQVTVRDSGVRVSPHGYNTEDDIDRVLSIFG